MRSFMLVFATAALSFVATPSTAANLLADGGFENQGKASHIEASFCYLTDGGIWGSTCADGPWKGGSGIQHVGNGIWPGTPTPDGEYYGFIQFDKAMSQTFTNTTAGTFSVDWLVAGRNNTGWPGNQTYDVLITPEGGTAQRVYQDSTTTGQPFTWRRSAAFDLGVGTYTLTFKGLNPLGGDNTAFIDAVRIGDPASAVPEPATWLTMILGIGVAGATLRRRRRAAVA